MGKGTPLPKSVRHAQDLLAGLWPRRRKLEQDYPTQEGWRMHPVNLVARRAGLKRAGVQNARPSRHRHIAVWDDGDCGDGMSALGST